LIDPDVRQLKGLIARLNEVDSEIQALTGGQGDVVINPTTAAPTMLRAAQEHEWIERARLERVIEATVIGILRIDSTGRVISINAAACRLLGRLRLTTIGRSYEDLKLRLIDAAGCAIPPDQQPPMIALRENRSVLGSAIALGDSDGRIARWLLVSAQPFEPEGEQRGVLSVLVDITGRIEAEQTLAVRARQHEVVAELGQIALSGSRMDSLFESATQRVRSALDVEHCSLLELRGRPARLVLRAGSAIAGATSAGETAEFGARSHIGHTAKTGEPVIVSDFASQDRFDPPAAAGATGTRSAMSVLVSLRSGPYGVLAVHSASSRGFTGDDVNFLQSMANVLGAAIDRAQADETIRKLTIPVLAVDEGVLLLPLVGHIDAARASDVTEQLLSVARDRRARAVVIDLTGVHGLNQFVLTLLVRGMRACHLLGAHVVFTGISSELATTLVTARGDLETLTCAVDLRSGLERARQVLSRRDAGPRRAS
jgi:anti-anti-sigma regulatory factor/PAS domain-containing protein